MRKLFFSIFERRADEIESLNGIRALGSLIVIFFHYWGVVRILLPEKDPLFELIVENLESVMDLFFILSAFLIGGGLNYLWKKNGTVDFKNYFFKRSIRIFPAFYVFLLMMVLIGYFQIVAYEARTLDENQLHYLIEFKKAHSYWIYDFFYLSNYSENRLVIHGWSLSMEEQFYFILPVLTYFFLFRTGGRLRMLFLVLLYLVPLAFRTANLPAIDTFSQYQNLNFFPTHSHGDSLVLGLIVMELFFNHRKLFDRFVHGLSGKLLLFCSLALLFYSHTIRFEPHSFMHSALRINLYNLSFAVLFLFSIEASSFLSRFLSLRIFLPFARVSYSMYLYHMIGLGIVGTRFFDAAKVPTLLDLAEGYLIAVFVCFLIGWLSYLFVELPFIHLKGRMKRSNRIVLLNGGKETSTRNRPSESVAGGDLRYLSGMIDFYLFVPSFFLFLFSKAVPAYSALFSVLSGGSFLAVLLLQFFFIDRHGVSIGKFLYRLSVVESDGSRPAPGKYLLWRGIAGHLFYLFPPLGFGIDAVLLALPDQKGTLKDRLSKTRVVFHPDH